MTARGDELELAVANCLELLKKQKNDVTEKYEKDTEGDLPGVKSEPSDKDGTGVAEPTAKRPRVRAILNNAEYRQTMRERHQFRLEEVRQHVLAPAVVKLPRAVGWLTFPSGYVGSTAHSTVSLDNRGGRECECVVAYHGGQWCHARD